MAGCGSKVAPLQATYENEDCRQMWMAVERSVDESQVGDAETVKVEGYPYLRSNRYLHALAEMASSQEEKLFVLKEMRRLDLQKRKIELLRLDQEKLENLLDCPVDASRSRLMNRLADCSKEFMGADTADPDFFEKVRQGVDLDRDYSLWLRSVGLYPITSLVVDIVAKNAQAEMVDHFSRSAADTTWDGMVTFKEPAQAAVTANEVVEIVQKSRTKPFLSYRLTSHDSLLLARKFAPLLSTGNLENHDKFGKIILEEGKLSVDHQTPVVYYYFSQTFIQGSPALQLNYVIWFAKRTKPAPWFEKGDFDGLTFRLTLGRDAQPIFVDVMLNCGCYHFVLYDGKKVSGLIQDAAGFQPTVGGEIPQRHGNEQFHFKIRPGWHQVDQILASPAASADLNYQLRPYEELEYIADQNRSASLFDSQGLVPGSNRLERFFLFCMGIPKVGTMRQRGRHPITLIGRGYFDDPYLFDTSFSYRDHNWNTNSNERQGE